MEVYIFYDSKLENGTIVLDFFEKIKKIGKHSLNLESFLKHSFLDRENICLSDRCIKSLNQKCYDGKDIYEYKRKYFRLLIRIFFVCDHTNILFFGFLDKEDKRSYNRIERQRIKQKYDKQIFYTKEYYKEYGKNLNKFIKFEYYE
jgi:hypothetical protein